MPRPLTLGEIADELLAGEDPGDIILFLPDDGVVTDEDSGDENEVNILRFPSRMLRSQVEVQNRLSTTGEMYGLEKEEEEVSVPEPKKKKKNKENTVNKWSGSQPCRMGTIIRNLTQYYHFVNNDLADPRTNFFPLVSSPLPILAIMYAYHQFVRSWGPAFMAKRPPYQLKNLIILYNIVQICLSSYLAIKCLRTLYLSGYYSVWCQKMMPEDTPLERVVVAHVWLYYVIKIIDLLDTVFFILRKKFSQVSFLHVYHHLGMCLLGFIGTKYVPGGHGIMLGFINSAVHSVMYSYYLISIVRPQWVRRWWKKYITQLQILQFLLLILHFGHVLFEPSCEYPKWVSLVFLPHNIFILFLFSDFYIKEYVYKKKNKTKSVKD